MSTEFKVGLDADHCFPTPKNLTFKACLFRYNFNDASALFS